MADLHKEFFHTDLSAHFPRPKFHVVMLYIGEEESVRRQMARGEKVAIHNAQVRKRLGRRTEYRAMLLHSFFV
jgi:adenylate kinase